MLRLDPDSESPEKPCKGTYYLHRVLGLREYAVVVLENQANAFFLEPFPYILIAEGRERTLHQPFSSRVGFCEIIYRGERVGKIAASSSGNGNLCKRSLACFVDAYRCVWEPALEFDCAEATGGTCSYDCYSHIMSSLLLTKLSGRGMS